LEEVFPQACQVVLDVLSEVFDHDEQARKENMSPAERLAYHQALSRPLMDELKVWLDRQIDDRLVEPNSALGQAIAYMQNHWMNTDAIFSGTRRPAGQQSGGAGVKAVYPSAQKLAVLPNGIQRLCGQYAHQFDRHVHLCGDQSVGLPRGASGAPRRGVYRSLGVVAVDV
jgi:hypothetical protein